MKNPRMNFASKAIEKEFHPKARKLALEYVDTFATSLILQAKIIAFRKKAEIVLSNHVDEAVDAIKSRENRSWLRELLLAVGSALLGAFVPGFITELSTGNQNLLITYTILGFIGLLMIFMGLRQGK